MVSKETRTNPRLWEAVKNYVKYNYKEKGKWNAYKSAISVKMYKSLGGKYKSKRSRKNSLRKWLDEEWSYVNPRNKNSRFLPKAVISQMSPKLKRKENSLKKRSRKSKKSKAKYSKELNKLMKKNKIY